MKKDGILLSISIIIMISFFAFVAGMIVGEIRNEDRFKEIGHYEVLQKKVIYELQQQPDSTVIWVRMK